MKSLFEEEEKETAINQLKVELIARFYPLTNDEVIKYKEVLFNNESHIVWNKLIHWDYDLIEVLKDKLDWDSIWRFPNIKFDLNFFKKYEDRINFKSITSSNSIEWSDEFVAAYGDKFEVDERNILSKALSNINFVRIHKDVIDWCKSSRYLNFGFTDSSMNEFENYIDWDSFSNNPNLPLTFEFLQKYKDKWNYNSLSWNPASLPLIFEFPTMIDWNWDLVIVNRGLKYNQDNFNFIFKHYSDKHQLKNFENPKYKNYAIYYFLHRLVQMNRDISSFFNDNYLKFMSFDLLSSKEQLNLNLDFITKYKDKLNFKDRNLIRNISEIVTEDFIIMNIEKFDLNTRYIYNLPISRDFIFYYIKDIDWRVLSRSRKLDWNWDFLNEHWDKFHTTALSENIGIYEKLINQTMSKSDIINFLDLQLENRN
jgi:hypothetical protein